MHKVFVFAAITAVTLIGTAPVQAQGTESGRGSMGGMGNHGQGDMGTMDSHGKSMMQSGQPATAAEGISAVGVINSIDESGRSINLSHEPIAELGWPSMTMDMTVSESVDLTQVPVGAPVDITLTRGTDGIYMVDDVEPR